MDRGELTGDMEKEESKKMKRKWHIPSNLILFIRVLFYAEKN